MPPKIDFDLHTIRTKILAIFAATSKLASAISGESYSNAIDPDNLRNVLHGTIDVAVAAGIDLSHAIATKMKINAKKYPVEHCKDSISRFVHHLVQIGTIHFLTKDTSQIEKYTALSDVTGITKTNQVIYQDIEHRNSNMWVPLFMSTGLRDLSKASTDFVASRKWQHHDTPLNLALALCSEAGELADVVAWQSTVSSQDKLLAMQNGIAQELADVTILLVRFARIHNIDIHNITCKPRCK